MAKRKKAADAEWDAANDRKLFFFQWAYAKSEPPAWVYRRLDKESRKEMRALWKERADRQKRKDASLAELKAQLDKLTSGAS